MDPDKKRILQKEIADYSKTVFNRIYDSVKIEDVAVKINPIRLRKPKQVYSRYTMRDEDTPNIGYITYLIKLGIGKEDVSDPMMTIWEQLYYNYNMDVAYMASQIIHDQILRHFFGDYSDTLVDNIMISDKNGNVIYSYER